MSQGWYATPATQGGDYDNTQGWMTQQQRQDQQSFGGAGAWSQDPYNDEPNGFHGFYNGQFDGSQDLKYDVSQGHQFHSSQNGQYHGLVNQLDGAQDTQYDGLPVQNEEVKEEEKPTKSSQVHTPMKSYRGNKSMKSGGGYTALLPTEAHYHLSRDSRLKVDLTEKKADGAVCGAPMDDKTKRYWIGRLFNAFKNTVDIKDKNCKNGKPAQSAQRLRGTYYPDLEIERVCWKIFLACTDSQYGVKLVEAYHKTKWECNTTHPTFEHRMETIIGVLTESKAMCKQLLDPPYYLRLVDAPAYESSLKDNNRKINSERDKQNEIGRKAIKKGIDGDVLYALPDFKSETPPPESENEGAESARLATHAHRRKASSATGRSAASSSKKRELSSRSQASPGSAVKRKTRSTASKNYREDTEEEDDSDVSEYEDDEVPRSKKRAATKAAQAKVATPTHTRATVRKSAPKAASETLPVRNESQPNPTSSATVNISTSAIRGEDVSDAEDDRETEYKRMICDILQVDREFGETYTIEELRTYARAYNLQFAFDDWEISIIPGAHGRMFRVITPTGLIGHFAHVFPKYAAIAKARGDLNDDATVNLNSPHMSGFSTNGNVHKDMVLGVVPNPFGMHDQLWNTI